MQAAELTITINQLYKGAPHVVINGASIGVTSFWDGDRMGQMVMKYVLRLEKSV